MRIGVRELRQNASRYLAMVKAGERVEITERGVLVAVLSPPDRQALIRQELEERGLLRKGTGGLLDVEPLPLPEGAEPPSAVLERMRADER
jgi:prevent-host-death family protein